MASLCRVDPVDVPNSNNISCTNSSKLFAPCDSGSIPRREMLSQGALVEDGDDIGKVSLCR